MLSWLWSFVSKQPPKGETVPLSSPNSLSSLSSPSSPLLKENQQSCQSLTIDEPISEKVSIEGKPTFASGLEEVHYVRQNLRKLTSQRGFMITNK